VAAAHAARRGASDAAEDLAALERLGRRQQENPGSTMDELLCYDAKAGHWAWWAFPTPTPGQSEPKPHFYVTPATAPALFDRAPPCWKSLLECLAHLPQRRRLGDVLHTRDLARFADFLAFWFEVACPQWLRQVLRTFGSYLCGHRARQLRQHAASCGGGGGGGDGAVTVRSGGGGSGGGSGSGAGSASYSPAASSATDASGRTAVAPGGGSAKAAAAPARPSPGRTTLVGRFAVLNTACNLHQRFGISDPKPMRALATRTD